MAAPTSSRRRLYTAGLVICIALLIGPACASADFSRCCMQSARLQLTTLQVLPWDACGINQTSQSQPNPLVNSTLGWCEQNCPGFQLSTFNQWSDLLTTFIVPAFAQLLLCPVGGGGEDEEEEEGKKDEMPGRTQNKLSTTCSGVKGYWKKKRTLQSIFYLASEYIVLLGDPASAMSGCVYQLWTDFVYVWDMASKNPPTKFKKHVIGFAILAGQTTLQRTGAELKPSDVDDIANLVRGAILKKTANATTNASTSPPPGDKTISQILADQTKAALVQTRDVEKDVAAQRSAAAPELKSIQNTYDQSELRKELQPTIETLLKANTDFVNGIVIPVVLTFAGTAAGFYNAYTVLGDRDKGYSLAFGVFYAWLLVLAVVSNCYATTVNAELLEDSLEDSLKTLLLSSAQTHPAPEFRFRVVPFRKRIPTIAMWARWVDAMTDTTPVPLNAAFFAKFLARQTAGWLTVAVFPACATLIAYNTPTIGLGCRSFTFLLYAFLSLILAWLLVAREAATHNRSTSRAMNTLRTFLSFLYGALAFLNAFVLVGGTTFHLVGLYRSCRCQLLFGHSEALVVLSTGTELDVERARTYWISVGYVAFMFAWLVCMAAIMMREYITLHLKSLFPKAGGSG